ncbi:MAG: tetratricopeptide repeat protein [Paracoccaceae bacterium]
MSNPESFIDEVTEEVRRDRLFALFRRYGWIAALLVLLIVGGAAYNEYRKAQDTAAARALGDAMMQALDKNDADARVAALNAIDAKGEAGAVVALLAAGEEVSADQREAAATQLQAVAGNMELPAVYRQLATLKLVLVQGDNMPADERTAALEPLAEPGQPFRPLALEQLGLVAAEQGDTETAIAHLRDAQQSADATAGLRQRVTQLIVALGGTAEPA